MIRIFNNNIIIHQLSGQLLNPSDYDAHYMYMYTKAQSNKN